MHDAAHEQGRQLDIFADSRDVALRNDVAAAITRGDADAARCATDALRAEFGGDPALALAKRLIGHLVEHRRAPASALIDPAQVVALRLDLAQTIAPAAQTLLGREAAAGWLAAQWRRLAQRTSGIAWHAERAQAHAAGLYLEAEDWREAADAVQRIDSWRRIPQPLTWMAQAQWQLGGGEAGWPLLAEALWLAPARTAALIPRLPDPRLYRLARRFEEDFDPADGADWAWFPAWALVEQPQLAAVLGSATSPDDSAPVQGFGLVMALLRLERQGRHHDIVDQRRRLRSVSARLFAAYMRTR